MSNETLVSVIILNWNGSDLITKCIDAVRDQTYKPLELIVVDNASTDDSLSMIKKYENLKLVENTENLGFSRAVNIGIRESKGDYVMPLNNDVFLEKEYVEYLVREMDKNEKTGSVSGKLIKSKTRKIDTVGHSIHKNRLPRNIGSDQEDGPQYSIKKEVFGVCGAAPLYKRKMLEDVEINGEYYDESFFAFLEDVDLDWRARLLGWRSFYVPESVAFHHRGGTAVRRSKTVEMHNYKNRYLMIIKNDDPISFLKNLHQIVFTDIIKNGALLVRYPTALLGFADVLRLLPETIRKRKIIRRKRKVSRKEMERWFLPFDYKEWFRQHATSDVYDLSK